jgi:YbbR domain-containing protein
MNIRKLLTEHWSIKLLSLGLALTLWFYVTSKGKTEMTLSVPLELRNIPQALAIVGDVAGALDVRVQGQERVLRDITIGKKVFGVLDLSMSRAGENIVPISPDDIRRPSGVTVMHLSLSEVRVRLEPLVRRAVRLKPVLHGTPAFGFHVAKVTVSPAKITVEGPSSIIKTLDVLQTMPIDIQGAGESITVDPKIDYQGKSVKILEKNIAVRIAMERGNR